MSKTRAWLAAAAFGCGSVLGSSPAVAGILYTGLSTNEVYRQNANGTEFLANNWSLTLAAQGANDFTSISVFAPGQSTPMQYDFVPRLATNGAYSASFAQKSFISAADAATARASMSAAAPFGDYTFVATNNVTAASQSATLSYDLNHWPAVPGSPGQMAVPALTAASYANLQGLNATLQHAFAFNSFVGNGIPLSVGEVTPAVTVTITKNGQTVYRSAPMPASTTNFVLPADTLAPNTVYSYAVTFRNGQHCGGTLTCGTGNPVGFYRDFSTVTAGQFTTSAASSGNPVALALQGGTLSNPVPLQHQGEIGQVNGTIGGAGSTAFYRFYWAGGEFKANSVMTGADPDAIYEFQLLNRAGFLLEKHVLDLTDGFTADLRHTLAAGTYDIGILSVTEYDPAFTITFDTPVFGVPEPGTLGLVGLCLAGLGIGWRRRKPG